MKIKIILFFLLSLFYCKSFQTGNYYWNSIFYFENSFKIPQQNISFKNLLKKENLITPKEWNDYAIQFYYENEFYHSEYCFLKAISLYHQLEEEPLPYTINYTIQSFLNLLFFYELINLEEYKSKSEKYLKDFIKLIENREDLVILALQEIRKRNFSNLEYKLANSFYQHKEKHTDQFLYEYLLALQNSNKLNRDSILLTEKIKESSLRSLIYEELGFFFNSKKNYKEFIYLYEYLEKKQPEWIKIKINDIYSNFYIENIFNQYYLFYLENFKNKIPENIYKKTLELKELEYSTYSNLLSYFKQEYFLFSKELSLEKINIKNRCKKEIDLFYRMCNYENSIKKAYIQKKIFKTINWEELKKAKDFMIHFY